jgi:hypothetical protein
MEIIQRMDLTIIIWRNFLLFCYYKYLNNKKQIHKQFLIKLNLFLFPPAP